MFLFSDSYSETSFSQVAEPKKNQKETRQNKSMAIKLWLNNC